MNPKKILVLSLLVMSTFFLLSFHKSGKGGYFHTNGEENFYEQNSPVAKHTWVKKLKERQPDGSTMQMMIEFEPGTVRDQVLTMYPSQERKVIFFDDGKNGGDYKAGDNIFSGFVIEDADRFAEICKNFESVLTEKKSFLTFNGHLGTQVTKIPHFDIDKFQVFEPVDFDPQLINAANCNTDILKERSLLVTDLNVVEDPARTYNICNNTGNPWGAWTFGTLMKCIAHESTTGMSAKKLIKLWLNNWMANHLLNGQFVINSHLAGDFSFPSLPSTTDLRENEMLVLVITPWLRNAYGNPTLSVSLTNWQSLWDAANQDDILKFAPMKLTAIVNRLDLRGNHGYSTSLSNAGETRFIFSVVNGNVGSGSCGVALQNAVAPVRQGFNVILEYGNPQTNCAALKTYAQQWLDLSDLALGSLGSPAYNAALEAITTQVTDSGAGGASKPNQSAINQIRTNEIALSQGSDFIITNPPANTFIPLSRWQLEEFHLNGTSHAFELAPVVKTPRIHANGGDGDVANRTQFNTTTASKFNFVDSIAKWVNVHHFAVEHGNINYPDLFPNSSKKVLGATSEIISVSPGHTEHFWDGNNPFVTYDASLNVIPSVSITSDLARQQFSVNTCAGCHGGETRTVFTQVRYLGYGQSADYWDPLNPDFSNLGGRKVDHVSPFLTGRKRRDGFFFDISASPSGNFSDQKIDGSETPDDDQLDGLFYTEDIAGRVDAFSNPILWSFNDLERRKIDMCQFLIASCDPFSEVFAVARIAGFQPFELGSH